MSQSKNNFDNEDTIEKEFHDAIEGLTKFEALLFGTIPPKSIEDVPSLNSLAVAILLKLQRESFRNSSDFKSSLQSEIARLPRPSRQKPERKTVQDAWLKWQSKPNSYPTQAAFIRDMQEKTGIDRPETIRSWVKMISARLAD